MKTIRILRDVYLPPGTEPFPAGSVIELPTAKADELIASGAAEPAE